MFSEIAPEAWGQIRAELTATALVKVEDDVQFNKRPYLRFHPTLPYAAAAADVPDPAAAEQRFIAVYLAVMQTADQALRGSKPAAGMALVEREEGNLRGAMARAFRRGERHEGWRLADTLREYLQRAGRLRERDALTQWVRGQHPADARLDAATCDSIRQHAWSLCTRGQGPEAVRQVEELTLQLEREGLADGSDATFQIAMSYNYLGRIYVNAHRPDLGERPLQKAIALYEQLGEAERGNLAAALGDLANAYLKMGRFARARETAERGLTINRKLGNQRSIAVCLGRIAQILAAERRHAEADARYGEALAAARAAGDQELIGAFLQHRGALMRETGNQDRAVELYREALASFQEAGEQVGEMQTCDLLASAELMRGQLAAAEAWYDKARELAAALGDQHHLANIAGNVGILYQTRAEEASDPEERAKFLRQAVASVEESLSVWVQTANQVNEAKSHYQLGVLFRMLGEPARAEEEALQGVKICEALDLPDVYQDYRNLADIAQDRGDAKAAAEWEAKCNAKVEELEQRNAGAGGGIDNEQLAQFVLALAQAAYHARQSGAPLAPDAAEALAQLAELPEPLPAVGEFLAAAAAGKKLPDVPGGLSAEVGAVLEELRKACA